jgi:hypothetical protein
MRKLMFTGLLFIMVQAFSQTDSVTTSKERPDSVEVKYDRIYKLFIEENNQEIRHLWKVDLVSLRINILNLSYEQKIGNCFSSETELIFGYSLQSKYDYDPYDYGYHFIYDKFKLRTSINKYAPIVSNLMNGIRIGGTEKIKYYYNLNRRVQKGKNINGFTGNYFSIHLSAQYGYGYKISYDYYPDNYYYRKSYTIYNDYDFVYGFGIGYGLQRRIGNIGFFEPSISIISSSCNDFKFNMDDFINSMYLNIAGNINIGFSIESVSSLKRMLKK